MNSQKSSPAILQINNINLHSPYNPEQEAEKIIERQLTNENAIAIIIIEPGLGYLIKIIKQQKPHCKIIALHVCNGIKQQAQWLTECVWEPQDGALSAYIARQLWQLAFPIVSIIENPAAQRINQPLYLTIKKIINHQLQRLISNFTTIASFANQWTINCINNFLHIKNKLTTLPDNKNRSETPIIIVGSGPSLNNTMLITAIREWQSYCDIWCLSSAMPILKHHNIIPNVLVTTDGGHWASYHLHNTPKQTIIAMPLTAKIHYSLKYNPVLLFNQQFAIEQAIADIFLNNQLLNIPARACVASSALELAQSTGSKAIALVGIDFGFHNGKQTAHPHAFTPLREQCTSILNHRDSTDFESFSQSHIADTNQSPTSLRMIAQHQMYREELAYIIQEQTSSIKNIYQCESINPLPKIKHCTIKELQVYIQQCTKNTTQHHQTNRLTQDKQTQLIAYSKHEIINCIDSAMGAIVDKIKNITSLAQPQAIRDICFGLAHKEYLQTCNSNENLRTLQLQKLKQTVIAKLCAITKRYNR